jgi:phage shock protein PspC (stress-responsive transcriptional regulator)
VSEFRPGHVQKNTIDPAKTTVHTPQERAVKEELKNSLPKLAERSGPQGDLSMKTCPFCAEEIQDQAVKCKHCGSFLQDSLGEPGYPPAAPSAGFPAGRLRRSSRSKMLSGVCGGLARYLGIDAVWVRIFYAIATLFFAIIPGIIVYVILSLVIPSDDQPEPF